ncbi:MAG: hypothetical protein QM493_04445 [Sulfurovum sp.]
MIIALIIVASLLTISLIFIQYDRHHNKKKLVISFATLCMLIVFVLYSNITRAILPLFIMHIIFILISWMGLIRYILYKRFRFLVIFAPLSTIVLFLILEYLVGSS